MTRIETGVDRATFIAGIRSALDRTDGVDAMPAPPAVPDALVRRLDRDADLSAHFAAAARDAGMTVRVIPAVALEDTIRVILTEHGCRRATISVADDHAARVARMATTAADATVVDWRTGVGLDRHYEADAGITDIEAAVAETGSIVVSSGALRTRGAFLVPPVHVALVPARIIVADLVDLWSTWRQGAMPTASVIVTGPSKTADIEGILITGVHGPKAVEIVLIEDA